MNVLYHMMTTLLEANNNNILGSIFICYMGCLTKTLVECVCGGYAF